MKIGIVICSRINSSRIPRKALYQLNGIPLIEHLITRLNGFGIQVILAIPSSDKTNYKFLKQRCSVRIITGSADDPLKRMYIASKKCKLDTIIRICHDKIFIDGNLLRDAIEYFKKENADYLYSTCFTDGSAFEILSFKCLEDATSKFKKVEHISYAAKSVAQKIVHYTPPELYHNNLRLLIDYPEDISLFETILSTIGNECTLDQAIAFLKQKEWSQKINKLPLITVYTCNFNMQAFIRKCMGSVAAQENFADIEYIIIDDFSSDKSVYYIARFATIFPNVQWFKNEKNLGLASSSNIALKHARGKYILRLDADDYFTAKSALTKLYKAIKQQNKDVIYPDYYFDQMDIVKRGNEYHHVGGALFSTKALNYIKFTEKLRGYDSLDIYLKAKDILNIGYLNEPMFLYRQHDRSLSKNNLKQRSIIKARLEEKYA